MATAGSSGAAAAFSPSSLSPLQWALDGGSAYESSTLDSYQVLRSLESYGTYRKPRSGRCGLFDGTNDYATLGARLQPTIGEVTISCWFKPGSTTDTQVLVSNCAALGANFDYQLEFNRTAGKISLWRESSLAGGVTGATSLSVGTWYHIVGVISGTTGAWTIKLYINSVEDASATTAMNSDGTTSSVFSIGRPGGYNGQYINGSLRDVRVYSTAKSAAQAAAIYNQASTPTTIDATGLLGGWWMNEEASTTAYDWSGNGKHLTLTNITTSTFHASDTGVTYNPANFLGFTLSGSTVIPRNEANTSLDASGGALGNTGKCPHPALIETPCITGDGTAVRVDMGSALIPATADFTFTFDYYHPDTTAAGIVSQNDGATAGRWYIKANNDASGSTVAGSMAFLGTIGANIGITGFVVGRWYSVTLSRSGSTFTLSATDTTTGAVVSGTSTSSGSLLTSVNTHLLSQTNTGFSSSAGRFSYLRVTTGGVTTHFPIQGGPGSSNTNRDLYYVKSDGTYGVVSGAIVNGTVSTIWANRCPGYVQDWCANYGGRLNAAGAFVPGLLSGSLCADGNAKTLNTAGTNKHGNPNSRRSPNPWDAPELRAIGYTPSTLYAPGDDVQSVSPADTKFRRTASDGDDRFISVATALTGTDKTNMESYVA